MATFLDRSVNLLNVHYGLRFAGIAGGTSFFLPHLIASGFTLPQVLLAVAAILAGRFVLRPLLVPVARRSGLRRLLIFGTLVCALQYPLIAGVEGIGARFLTYLAVASLGDMIYWTVIHAYFAKVGSASARGRQLGTRESIVALVAMVSPVAMGFILARAGAAVGFAISTAVTALSVVPLLFVPDADVPDVGGAQPAPRDSLIAFHADGWLGASSSIIWSTVLFVSLDKSYTAYGGAMALAALFGAVGAIVLGQTIDHRGGMRVVMIGLGVAAAAATFKAVAIGDALLVTAANALGAVAGCLYAPMLLTAIYNAAKASPCVLRFHVATEGAWDLGAVAALTTAAALYAAGAPLFLGPALAFVGIAIAVSPLLRYYRRAVPA